MSDGAATFRLGKKFGLMTVSTQSTWNSGLVEPDIGGISQSQRGLRAGELHEIVGGGMIVGHLHAGALEVVQDGDVELDQRAVAPERALLVQAGE